MKDYFIAKNSFVAEVTFNVVVLCYHFSFCNIENCDYELFYFVTMNYLGVSCYIDEAPVKGSEIFNSVFLVLLTKNKLPDDLYICIIYICYVNIYIYMYYI